MIFMMLQRICVLSSSSKLYNCELCIKRYKSSSPNHWTNKLKKTNPSNLALKHFDEFYKKIYKNDWPSIRIALLTQHKYVALVNNFGDTEQTIETLENLGSLNLQDVYKSNKEKYEEEQKRKALSQNEKQKEDLMKITGNVEDIQGMDSREEDEESEALVQRRNRTKKDHDEEFENITKRSQFHDYEVLSGTSLHDSIQSAELDRDRMVQASASGEMLYDFIPATKLKGMEEFMTDSEHMQYYRHNSEVQFKVIRETSLNISPYLHVYSFPKGDISDFPSPKRGVTGVFNYYCMDGASVLPVLALDIRPYDKVLDMCAAPGGKTLVALQTLYPDVIVANDLERSKRILEVMNQFIYDFNPKTDKRVRITNRDGLSFEEENVYDRILVDVPCTNDRLSVNEDFNNIFNAMKVKIRMKLPELQADLLVQALKMVKPGGSVVYSTCSLSPIQNDGVVLMALKRIWEETNYEIEISDLTEALKPFKALYAFANINMTYGNLVRPYLPSNFGPMYFCKLNKTK